MKKIATAFLLTLAIGGAARAQSFSGKTNAISLDYTQPVTATIIAP
ncbi:MAG: hypothetical protein WDN75_21795 [Bacteroidota bacterium]